MSSKPPTDTFTRFTSSQPHATTRISNPNPNHPSSTSRSRFTTSELTNDPRPAPSSFSQNAPINETPLEKVARLRAASRLAKAQASSSFSDRLVVNGRRWADHLHRFTTYGLIAFTGVSSVVAAYGITSLVAHNRRQKRAWVEREMDRLQEAQRAFLRGEADAEQLHLLQQERAGEELALQHKRETERKKQESYWSRAKALIGSQAAKGEMGSETSEEREIREQRAARQVQIQRNGGLVDDGFVDGEVGVSSSNNKTKTVAVPSAASGIKGVGVDSKGRPVPEGRVEYVTSKVETERRKGEKVVEQIVGPGAGGPLDVLAGNATQAAQAEGRGWLSWAWGGGKS